VLAQQAAVARRRPASSLPAKLSDADFWKLASDISEPGGYFRIADNFTSNENEVGRMFTMLRERKVTGGVYLGVGPEQNFSYIAATQPDMAFIIDIRRQAVIQHLMFKAMFEMSKDRADFVSILFSKARPASFDATTPVQRLGRRSLPPTDQALATKNHDRVVEYLTKTKKFTLTPMRPRSWISCSRRSCSTARASRPEWRRRRSAAAAGGGNSDVCRSDGWSTDQNSQVQSFLSTEEHFRTVKALHDKNLIVPVSGDFGGVEGASRDRRVSHRAQRHP
jgi:hypothetical protein